MDMKDCSYHKIQMKSLLLFSYFLTSAFGNHFSNAWVIEDFPFFQHLNTICILLSFSILIYGISVLMSFQFFIRYVYSLFFVCIWFFHLKFFNVTNIHIIFIFDFHNFYYFLGNVTPNL